MKRFLFASPWSWTGICTNLLSIISSSSEDLEDIFSSVSSSLLFSWEFWVYCTLALVLKSWIIFLFFFFIFLIFDWFWISCFWALISGREGVPSLVNLHMYLYLPSLTRDLSISSSISVICLLSVFGRKRLGWVSTRSNFLR